MKSKKIQLKYFLNLLIQFILVQLVLKSVTESNLHALLCEAPWMHTADIKATELLMLS